MSDEKRCINCAYLDQNNGRSHEYFGEKWNTYYCKECGGYHKPTEKACKYYDRKLQEPSSNCFITTSIVDILNYPDNCELLNTLRKFRDRYLQNNPKYLELLVQYDSIGPVISKKLQEREDRERLSMITNEYYLIPICHMLEDGCFDEAIVAYTRMVKFLQIQLDVSSIQDVIYDPSVTPRQMGHGTALVLRRNYE